VGEYNGKLGTGTCLILSPGHSCFAAVGPDQVPVVVGAVDEVREARALVGLDQAETEALKAEGQDIEVAQVSILLGGDSVEADQIAAATVT
jgi:hypothetical protein